MTSTTYSGVFLLGPLSPFAALHDQFSGFSSDCARKLQDQLIDWDLVSVKETLIDQLIVIMVMMLSRGRSNKEQLQMTQIICSRRGCWLIWSYFQGTPDLFCSTVLWHSLYYSNWWHSYTSRHKDFPVDNEAKWLIMCFASMCAGVCVTRSDFSHTSMQTQPMLRRVQRRTGCKHTGTLSNNTDFRDFQLNRYSIVLL